MNELYFVALRGVDEGDHATAVRGRRTVGQRISLRGRMPSEGVEIFDLEGEVGEIRTDLNRTAFVEFTNLDQFFTARCFQKNQTRSARRSVALHLVQPQHLFIKVDCPLEIVHTIAGVKKAGNHRKYSILDLRFSF